MAEPKRNNRKQGRTYEAPIEPAFNLRLVQQKPSPVGEDQNGLPTIDNSPSLTVNPPESGLLSRLIDRISKL